MKIILACLIAVVFLCADTIQAQDFEKDKKANEIMNNIYLDIIKINGSYDELKSFDINALKHSDFDSTLIIDFGYPVKMETVPKGAIWIYLFFSDNLEFKNREEFISKCSYVEDILKYFCYKIQSYDPRIEKDIIQIISKNIVLGNSKKEVYYVQQIVTNNVVSSKNALVVLLSNKESFEEVAKKYSIIKEIDRTIGIPSSDSKLDEALVRLAPGGTSSILELSKGIYYIIKMIKKE